MKIINQKTSFLKRNRHFLMAGACIGLSLAGVEAFAGLEEQIGKVDTLFKSKILKMGVGISAGLGVIRSIMQGNLPLAGGIIGVCVGAHYLLGWVQSDGFGS